MIARNAQKNRDDRAIVGGGGIRRLRSFPSFAVVVSSLLVVLLMSARPGFAKLIDPVTEIHICDINPRSMA